MGLLYGGLSESKMGVIGCIKVSGGLGHRSRYTCLWVLLEFHSFRIICISG
jgi:hypothetical protein